MNRDEALKTVLEYVDYKQEADTEQDVDLERAVKLLRSDKWSDMPMVEPNAMSLPGFTKPMEHRDLDGNVVPPIFAYIGGTIPGYGLERPELAILPRLLVHFAKAEPDGSLKFTHDPETDRRSPPIDPDIHSISIVIESVVGFSPGAMAHEIGLKMLKTAQMYVDARAAAAKESTTEGADDGAGDLDRTASDQQPPT